MISRYFIYFIIMSFVGYIYECIAMVIWTGKWDNRGFLYGPIIPIYGSASLFGTILFDQVIKDYSPLTVFLVSVFASAILEYVVHYTLEKIFHAYWWDYSKSPLNINGRICLPASLGFGLAGLIIIYLINPVLIRFINSINDLLAQFISLLFAFLFGADLTMTISVLSNFEKRVLSIDKYINEHMESLIGNITDESKGINTRFYSTVDKIEEKRKAVFNDRIERMINSDDSFYHRIINRVKGFTGKNAARLNEVLSRIKRRKNNE